MNADLNYYFLNKDDIENEDYIDKNLQKKVENENENSNLTILSVLEEEIMHFSVDRLHIHCLNLDLIAPKEQIHQKYISFEINKLKMNINTEKLVEAYDKEKDDLLYNLSKVAPNRIFHIRDISLKFSEINKCIFKNI